MSDLTTFYRISTGGPGRGAAELKEAQDCQVQVFYRCRPQRAGGE
jgi:hypothetical protein